MGADRTDKRKKNTNAVGADRTDKQKRNNEHQAAFRARRKEYIKTLEGKGMAEIFSFDQALSTNILAAVTSLEADLVELQELCRAIRANADGLRAEATRLRDEARDREIFWRAHWQPKKTGPTNNALLRSYARVHSPLSVSGRITSVSSPNDSSSLVSGYNGGLPLEYPQHSPALDCPDMNGDGSISTCLPSVTGYPPYPPFTLEGSSTAGESWQQHGFQSCIDYSMMDSLQPPITYATSPPITSNALLASAPYQYNFPKNSIIPDFRYSIGACEPTLHGGTADIPVAGSVGDNLQYHSVAATHANTMPNTGLVSAPYPQADNTLDNSGSDGSNSVPNQDGRLCRSAVATASSSCISCSPSPDSPYNTLSIIKAQSFGKLRRACKQAQRSSGGVPKAVANAISARGLLSGTSFDTNVYPNKQPRRDEDEDTHP